MTAFVRDLRLAVRVLLGTRTWTLVVLLSLALGIGANTALFTAVNGLILQTVSVHEPERLVRFNHAGRNDMVRNSNDYGYSGTSGTRNVRSTFSLPMIEQLRAANTTLTGLAAGVPMGSLNVARHEVRERPRSWSPDDVSVRLADHAAEPARRAQDRG